MKKFLLLLLLAPLGMRGQSLRVAVAANAQFVMEKLQVAFEKQTGIRIETVINSSGKITTQIQQGAPFDVFLSADMQFPQQLYQGGFTLEAPKIYAYGTLVAWTLGPAKLTKDLRFLTNNSIKKIAIANPQTAPYGEAALQALRYYGMEAPVQSKLVFGESISQVNQYVLSQVVEVGFTAKSVVVDPSLKTKGSWLEIEPKAYEPIAQGVVLIKKNADAHYAQARRFYAFLFSPNAQTIFRQYGYKISTSPLKKIK